MFVDIASRFKVGLKNVPVVGDSLRDLQAGGALGCAPHLVLTGKGESTFHSGGLPPDTRVHTDLAAMVSALLKTRGAAAHIPI